MITWTLVFVITAYAGSFGTVEGFKTREDCEHFRQQLIAPRGDTIRGRLLAENLICVETRK